jgi:hypothetical protein
MVRGGRTNKRIGYMSLMDKGGDDNMYAEEGKKGKG